VSALHYSRAPRFVDTGRTHEPPRLAQVESRLVPRFHSLFTALASRPYLKYIVGTTTMFKRVELIKPQRITIAIGV
jgi:hypothetical protein